MNYSTGGFASESAHIAELMLWPKLELARMVAGHERHCVEAGEALRATRHPVALFIQTECQVTGDDQDRVMAKDLSLVCYDWCMRSGFKGVSMNDIGRAIFSISQEHGSGFTRKDFTQKSIGRHRAYFGIRLRHQHPTNDWTLENLPDAGMVGQPVIKVDGYPFPGEVRAVFVTRAGAVRYVVEATGADYAGMLHIFNPRQLAPAPVEGNCDGA